MQKNDKIYVAGHTGLVGSALIRALTQQGYSHILTRTHQQLDLTEQLAVRQFFQEHQPDYVFLAAAKVGGIWANQQYPGDFIQDNLQIQTNVIVAAKENKVKRLLFFGSSCIYPRSCPQPIKEEYLLTGSLEPTNRSYAVAKIAGLEMCSAFNRQQGTHYLAVMPTNLYGPQDNYDLITSHVIPALIHKIHQAKLAHQPAVTVWGTGQARREFLYSDDLADASLFLMNLNEQHFASLIAAPFSIINVGCGQDLTIAQLAHLIAQTIGYSGQIIYDQTKPDGTAQKVLCVDRLNQLGWHPKTNLAQGLALAYQAFQERISSIKES